jgi:hypothetical protein
VFCREWGKLRIGWLRRVVNSIRVASVAHSAPCALQLEERSGPEVMSSGDLGVVRSPCVELEGRSQLFVGGRHQGAQLDGVKSPIWICARPFPLVTKDSYQDDIVVIESFPIFPHLFVQEKPDSVIV